MNRFIQSSIGLRSSMSGCPLVIGLVNNMSDRGLRTTEGQFTRLLRAACPGLDLELRLFSCRGSRPSRLQDGAGGSYADVEALFGTRLDAVIVTGMEPQAARLQDEPVWDSLTNIVDWAQDNAVPVAWSCLAAHAAVLHLDGIARSPLPGKMSGVFDCDLVCTDHPLAAGLPSRWAIPHSRYYDVAEAPLVANGYQILSRSRDAGVDIFLKEGSAPFVFFQGHPEYDPEILLLEYVRDVRRYLAGERDEYPLTPRNYIDPETMTTLTSQRDRVLHGHRDPAELKAVLQLLAGAAQSSPWHTPAVRLYANWIACMVDGRPGSPRLRHAPDRDTRCEPDLAASPDIAAAVEC